MNRYLVITVILIFIGVMLCEVHTIVAVFYPETITLQLNIWFDRHYDFPLSVSWYLYELENRLAMVIWFYAFVRIADLVSLKLKKIIMVFMIYFITQLLFWIWSRNTVFLSLKGYKILISNFIVYIYMAIALIYLFLPEKKSGKLISFQDRQN